MRRMSMLHRVRFALCGGAVVTLTACGPSAPNTTGRPATPAAPGAGDISSSEPARRGLNVLVFSRTAGFRHDSIEAGVASIERLGREHGWSVTATEDAARFNDEHLQGVDVVVFLSTTGDVLNDEQQGAMERLIASGAGFVGIHAAADTEYDWAWYGDLVGAYFKGHPVVQQARVVIEDADHPATRDLPDPWLRSDEWYDYRSNPRERTIGETGGSDLGGDESGGTERPARIRVLATILESSYEGGSMGEDHPIAWCHEFGGGRSWYTGGGHTIESFSEPEFLKHIAGGIQWAGGRD